MKAALTTYIDFTKWLEDLKEMPEELWLSPIAPGKWSTGEIIAHLKAWDIFVLEERAAYFVSGSEIPHTAVDVEEINKRAALEARFRISKDELLDEAIKCRQKVVKRISEVPESVWKGKIKIKESTITLSGYISGLVEHDQHHQTQIEEFLASKGYKRKNQVV
jgi:hypothetical protein